MSLRNGQRALRFIVLFAAVFSLVIVPASAVHAQSSPCFTGLSDADCQLIAGALANAGKITSFNLDFTVTTVANGFKSGNVNLAIQGSGPVDLNKIAGSTNLTDLMSNLIFSNTTYATIIVGNQKQVGTLNVRQIGRVMYLKVTPGQAQQWYKFSTEDVLTQYYGQNGQNTQLTQGGSLDLIGLFTLLDSQKIPNLFTVSSTRGIAVDGQSTTQITLAFNTSAFVKWLVAPENRQLLATIMRAAGQRNATSPQQLDNLARSITLFDPVFKNTVVSLTWLIGRKDQMYHGFGINFSTKADGTFASFLESQPNAQPFNITAKFLVTLSRINQPVTVDSVPNAQDITQDMLKSLPKMPLIPQTQL